WPARFPIEAMPRHDRPPPLLAAVPGVIANREAVGANGDALGLRLRKAAVFGGRLAVVVRLAERLPVAAIPEQRLVAAMRDDVVDHRRGLDASFPGAHAAQRMLGEEAQPSLLPLPG